AQDLPSLGAVVAEKHSGAAPMQVFDLRQPRQRSRLARGDHNERQRRRGTQGNAEYAKCFAPRKQTLRELQHIAPQRKPRLSTPWGWSGTGSKAGSASGVIWMVPRAGRAVSSASTTTTPG